MNRKGKKVALSLIAIVLGAGFLLRVIPPETILGETGKNTVTIDGLPVPNSLLPEEEFQIGSKKNGFVSSLTRDNLENRVEQGSDLWRNLPISAELGALPSAFVQGGKTNSPAPSGPRSNPPSTPSTELPKSNASESPSDSGYLPPLINTSNVSANPGNNGSPSDGNTGGSGPNGGGNGPSNGGGSNGGGGSNDGNEKPGNPPTDDGSKGTDGDSPIPVIPDEPSIGFPPVDPVDGPATTPPILPTDSPHSVPDSGEIFWLLLGSLATIAACAKRRGKC